MTVRPMPLLLCSGLNSAQNRFQRIINATLDSALKRLGIGFVLFCHQSVMGGLEGRQLEASSPRILAQSACAALPASGLSARAGQALWISKGYP